MSTRPSDHPAGWLLRPAENAAAVPHRARFRRWVVCGERSNYADVVIEPPLDPTESGVPETLTRVILAPRHRGVTLKSLTRFPADVYVATAPQVLLDAAAVQPDALKIRIWAVLEGAIQDE
ncbi:MAG TPA: hypothetical protein VMV92_09070 [Streptosporangiaceae bacterium]|nr:hypothetical protein [Streptosporangiaceae bacterium]